MQPTFSIAMAVYNRSRHIVPTIKSVLQQTFADFELLLVGDGCTDDTAEMVRPFLSERVIWRNLAPGAGNQYAANNAAIEMARGRYIAYLGHDDLWAPGHLAALQRTFLAHPDAWVAASGCICYGPPGSGRHQVSGLFSGDEAKFQFFFPPSSIAHRAELTRTIGPWRAPDTVKAPVDADLLLRAAHAGLTFASTGEISVHKFATGGRYLAYAKQDSQEQTLTLRMMAEPGFESFVAEILAHAARMGTVGLRYPDFANVAEGYHHEQITIVRGIRRPPIARLDGHAVMPPDNDVRGIDWEPPRMSAGRQVRWSGPNPRPKLLIPFTARGRTRVRFAIHDASADHVIEGIRLKINAEPVQTRIRESTEQQRRAVLECEAHLPATDPTIAELDLTGGTALEDLVRCVTGRPERIALAAVSLRPEQGNPGILARTGLRARTILERLTKR
jgi:glycosyltransferase involved in cell wall biosynthesis